jgi:hypothetical protein
MLLKFLPHGKGDPKRAVQYLIKDHDHKGTQRTAISVLEGDPNEFARIADSIPRAHKYTSGVLAFAPEDKPTPEQIEAVLADFRRHALAGVDEEGGGYMLAIQHIEPNGMTHVHVLIPNVDLVTGKAYNPAPPGWVGFFRPWVQAITAEQGFVDPMDPKRKRGLQPEPHVAYKKAADVRAGLTVEPDACEFLAGWIKEGVMTGLIENRADILDALGQVGKITRAGKDYIGIQPEGEKTIRLKGALFLETFCGRTYREDQAKNRLPEGGPRPDAGDDLDERRRKAATIRGQLESTLGRRREACKASRAAYWGARAPADRADAHSVDMGDRGRDCMPNVVPDRLDRHLADIEAALGVRNGPERDPGPAGVGGLPADGREARIVLPSAFPGLPKEPVTRLDTLSEMAATGGIQKPAALPLENPVTDIQQSHKTPSTFDLHLHGDDHERTRLHPEADTDAKPDHCDTRGSLAHASQCLRAASESARSAHESTGRTRRLVATADHQLSVAGRLLEAGRGDLGAVVAIVKATSSPSPEALAAALWPETPPRRDGRLVIAPRKAIL